MAELDAKKRAHLPDSAFAYVDARGRRLLPINDAAHVKNALSRFNQVRFENDAARERARRRILRAASRYGIASIGFVTGQIRSSRRVADAGRILLDLGPAPTADVLEARLRDFLRDPTLLMLQWSESTEVYLDATGQVAGLPVGSDLRTVTLLERDGRPMAALVHDPAILKEHDVVETVTAAVRLSVENQRLHGELGSQALDARRLPTGTVTFLLTDMESSTGLLRRLGDRYAPVLADVRSILRAAVREHGGHEVDARADEFFAAFEDATAALDAAVAVRRRIEQRPWPDGERVRLRAGIHTGTPTLTDAGYVGLSVHTAARVCSAARGGQILLSEAARDAIAAAHPALVFQDLGPQSLRGLPEPIRVYEATSDEAATSTTLTGDAPGAP